MQEPSQEKSPQELLDQLVDNELAPLARRELLLQLDRQPDGWRRCALAFLEAQAWRGILRPQPATKATTAQSHSAPVSLLNEPRAAEHALLPLTTQQQAAPQQKTRPTATGYNWNSPWALAASVLIAFGLGLAIQESIPESWPRGGGNLPTSSRATTRPTSSNMASTNQANSNLPSTNARRQLAASAPRDFAPLQNVTLVVGEDGRQELVQVPVSESDATDPTWWQRYPAPLTHEQRQSLQQAGQQVEHRRKLYPFQLQDGRNVLVPVDEVEINPVKFH